MVKWGLSEEQFVGSDSKSLKEGNDKHLSAWSRDKELSEKLEVGTLLNQVRDNDDKN
jgi:hypothetical protein